jgi:hypothetical protein
MSMLFNFMYGTPKIHQAKQKHYRRGLDAKMVDRNETEAQNPMNRHV